MQVARGRLAVLALIGAMGGLIFSCVCAAGMYLVAPKVLGAGPDGIELRPTPGAIVPELALPEKVAGYERGECRSVRTFRGLDLGPDAVEAIYNGPGGSVRVLASRLGSYHDAAVAVSDLAQRLEEAGGVGSHRLLAEELSEGWWSASGKRNFVRWHAPGSEADRHIFIWQSGQWCFIVASNNPVARRDVTLAFPY